MMKRKKPKTSGRPNKATTLLPPLKKLGVFRVADAKRLGISQPTLSRLVAAEQILRVGRGLYAHADTKINPELRDYIIACTKFGPHSAVGGMTALFHYGLIEQVPRRLWMVVPSDVKAQNSLYRCIRTKTNPLKGVVDNGGYRITNLERTLVEAFRYATKIGLRIALRATRTALAEKRTTLQKIHVQAKVLGLERFVERHWEAIIPEGEAA